MLIGGLEKLSLIDYPGHLSAIVFTKGCNFRCSFCYNPMLVCSENEEGCSQQSSDEFPLIDEDDFFQFLETRKGKLEAVVVTGGEPTLQKDLLEFITKIKQMGFLVKLDTNGTNPEVIKKLIEENLIDYLAMDLKADEDGYEKTVSVKVSFEQIEKSVKIIMSSGLPYEFRTTCVPDLINKEMVGRMGEIIKGADKWYLQKFKSDVELVNNDFESKKSFTDIEMDEFVEIASGYAKECSKRG